MEFILEVMACISTGVLIGYKTHAHLSIDYKSRWKEALDILKQEKLGSEELLELEDGESGHFKKGSFIKMTPQDAFRKLNHRQRYDLEELRLRSGYGPKDAFGGAEPQGWTNGRKLQLRYGWDYDVRGNGGWRKIK